MVKDALEFHNLGYRVLANFSLDFAEFIDSEELMQLSKHSDLFNCVLVLDELQLFFDSRNFRNNIQFSNFIQQTRKRNIIILGTTQYTSTIELRFRQNIDKLAIPSYNRYTKYCSVEYFDLTLLEDINLHSNSVIPSVEIIFNAVPIFKHYNTNEMLK